MGYGRAGARTVGLVRVCVLWSGRFLFCFPSVGPFLLYVAFSVSFFGGLALHSFVRVALVGLYHVFVILLAFLWELLGREGKDDYKSRSTGYSIAIATIPHIPQAAS